MLSSIKSGIHEGSINQDNKLYIDDDIPEYLPSLCWNIDMGGRFIKRGNYQWMFSRKEVGYFAESIRDATWIIDKEDFSLIKKSPENIFKEAKKINTIKDKWYIATGKDEEYLDLGHFFKGQGNYNKAEEMFKKAIEMNPKNDEAYGALGECYRMQGKYKEVERYFRRQ